MHAHPTAAPQSAGRINDLSTHGYSFFLRQLECTQKDLDELRYNLAHLSVDAVRRFFERAHEDCRMIYDRLPSPKQMQTLVQVWRQLFKWR